MVPLFQCLLNVGVLTSSLESDVGALVWHWLKFLLTVVLVLVVVFWAQSLVPERLVSFGWLVLIVRGSLQHVQERLERRLRVVLLMSSLQSCDW